MPRRRGATRCGSTRPATSRRRRRTTTCSGSGSTATKAGPSRLVPSYGTCNCRLLLIN
uniref:Uncharacterized protein n=1 Tax=Arundo donax TaxID=35708 RepID=A0A0A9AHN9_ARUDO